MYSQHVNIVQPENLDDKSKRDEPAVRAQCCGFRVAVVLKKEKRCLLSFHLSRLQLLHIFFGCEQKHSFRSNWLVEAATIYSKVYEEDFLHIIKIFPSFSSDCTLTALHQVRL